MKQKAQARWSTLYSARARTRALGLGLTCLLASAPLGLLACAGNKLTPTIDDSLERERKYLNEQAKTKEEKKTSEERIGELEKSKGELDGAVRNAEGESKELDQTIRQAQGDYDAAFDALLERIRARPAPAVATK